VFGIQSRSQKQAAAAAAAAAQAAALEAAASSNKIWGRPQVEIVRTWAKPRVDQRVVAARDWAKPRVGRGIEVAVPKLDSAVQSLAPVVDRSRDKIVDELLPRLSELISALAASSLAAKDEAVERTTGAAAVLSGDADAQPKSGGRGRLVLLLSLVAGAVAAGGAAFSQSRKSADDPWATPLSDPYAAPVGDTSEAASAMPVFDATAASAGAGGAAPVTVVGDAGTNDPSSDVSSLDGLVSVDDSDDVTVLQQNTGDQEGENRP